MTGSSVVSFGYWAVAGALAVAVGVGVAVWHGPSTVEVPTPQRDIGSQGEPMPAPPVLAGRPAPATDAAPARQPAAEAAVVPPPGVSAADWRALQAELADRPDELRRLGDYFVFADQVQRFHSLGRSAAASTGAERQALARALDAGLDQRLRQRELNAAEARLIKIAVLDVLVDGDPARRQALAAWEAGAAQAARPIDAETAAARNAEFQRLQAEVVAAWSAVPAGQRDPRELERRLDALRAQHYAPAR